jgi:hypothetical protein
MSGAVLLLHPHVFMGVCSENFTTCVPHIAINNSNLLVFPNGSNYVTARVVYEVKQPQPLPVNITQITYFMEYLS